MILNKNYFILLLLLTLAQISVAQNKNSIYLNIKDIETNKGIGNVNVIVKNNYIGTSSATNGLCKIITYTLPITLQFSHVSYKNKSITVNRKKIRDTIIVYLVPKLLLLEQVIISAKRERVFKQPKYSIMDFEFLDNQLLILEYNKSKIKEFRLILTDNLFNINTIYKLPPHIKPISFFIDCLEYCHLITKDSAYQISYTDSQLSLNYPMDIDRFHKVLDNCLFKTDSNMFFQHKFTNGYAYEFYTVNLKSNELSSFISSYDVDRLLALQDEIKFIKNYPPPMGVGFAIRFARQFDYPPFEQYLMKLGDTLYYFNHQSSSIDVFTEDCNLIRSTEIYYHLNTGWTNRLISDTKQKRVYTIIKDNLFEISLKSGEIISKTKIVRPEKVLINDDIIFVLKKRLYVTDRETFIEKIKL